VSYAERDSESNSLGSRTSKRESVTVLSVVQEIDIWRVAVLMVKRYADDAEANADRRVDELETEGDQAGAAILASGHVCDRAANRANRNTALIIVWFRPSAPLSPPVPSDPR
jgi:hypothetical protein